MRRTLAWCAVCAASLAASCSSSPAGVSDAGGDDATADAAGGVDAAHDSGAAADASDAHADGPADATADGDATADAHDAAAESAVDAAEASADAPGDSPVDAAPDSAADAGPVACFAMRIDQQNAHVTAPSAGWNLGGGDWTLEAWIKPHGAFAGNVVFVLNEANLANEVRLLYDDTTGAIGCSTYSGSCPCGKGTGNMTLSAGNLRDGRWHHAACMRQGSIGKLYVDGVEADTDVVSTNLVPASNIAFGQPSGYPSYQAAPVVVGPFRFSSAARYVTSFTPAHTWPVDAHTVTQYLSATGFAGSLVDEAGGDNTSTAATGVSASSDTPCSPAGDAGTTGDGGDAGDAGSADSGGASDAAEGG